jgi:hypothetical protein
MNFSSARILMWNQCTGTLETLSAGQCVRTCDCMYKSTKLAKMGHDPYILRHECEEQETDASCKSVKE